MSRVCMGCGVLLQSENNGQLGYVKEEKFSTAHYCERCFKLIHYNEPHFISLKGINASILKEVNKNKAFVFYFVDFLNINEETISTFKKIQGKKNLVISKLDIIPKSIKTTKIKNWLKKEYSVEEEILFVSSKKKKLLTTLYKRMENEKKIYILGYTNAGKSSFINQVCMDYNLENKLITASLYPNTTLDFIPIYLKENVVLIDSPGFTYNESLYAENEVDFMEKIIPKVFLKPTTFQVKPISAILVENKIRIESSVSNSFTFYISNSVLLKRVFQDNKEIQDKHRVLYSLKDNQELVVKGLGFVHIQKACTLTIYMNNPNLVEIRNTIFK